MTLLYRCNKKETVECNVYCCNDITTVTLSIIQQLLHHHTTFIHQKYNSERSLTLNTTLFKFINLRTKFFTTQVFQSERKKIPVILNCINIIYIEKSIPNIYETKILTKICCPFWMSFSICASSSDNFSVPFAATFRVASYKQK